MNMLTICDTAIHQDNEGRFCLNDLHKAAGEKQKHRPKYWLENQQTKELITAMEYGAEIPPILAKQGLGTFVQKELVYDYAMWISAAFKVKVIRAYDAMMTQQPPHPQIPKTLGEALFLAAKLENEREAFAKQIEADRPKVAFFEAVAQAEDSNIMLREAAKVLGTGERRLRNLLRDKQYLMKDGLPYQCYIERGLFEVKERVTYNLYGKAVVYSVALVTPKGMIPLQEKFFPASAKQLPLQWPANPFPEGMREDSATSRVYKLLKENPDIWFTAGQLESLTKAKRGGISWAIRQLRKEGLIEHTADDARNPAYFQYRLASAIKAA